MVLENSVRVQNQKGTVKPPYMVVWRNSKLAEGQGSPEFWVGTAYGIIADDSGAIVAQLVRAAGATRANSIESLFCVVRDQEVGTSIPMETYPTSFRVSRKPWNSNSHRGCDLTTMKPGIDMPVGQWPETVLFSSRPFCEMEDTCT